MDTKLLTSFTDNLKKYPNGKLTSIEILKILDQYGPISDFSREQIIAKKVSSLEELNTLLSDLINYNNQLTRDIFELFPFNTPENGFILTSEQIDQLVSNKLIASNLTNEMTLHILSMLVDMGAPKTLLQINRSTILEVIMESELMLVGKDKYQFNLELLRYKSQLTEGAEPCRKCGSREVITISYQSRSADEPMTNLSQCNSCKNRWKH